MASPLHVPSDMLLSLLRGLVSRRPELRVVLMSATADTSVFACLNDEACECRVPVNGKSAQGKALYAKAKSFYSK